MPCTFSHPLAIVPLRRFCPSRLNFAALVIGSMSPDFGYYVQQFRMARIAHTIFGTFTVCLPIGLFVLGVFYLLRRPLCFALPQPHRAALMPLASIQPELSVRALIVAAGSVLLGAWSHTIWDSFTHDRGWAVERVPLLRTPVLHIGATALPVSYVLQQASTFGAGAFLAILYIRWLRRQRMATTTRTDSFPDRWRYALLALLAVIAIAAATPAALRNASLFEGYTAFRVFVFRAGVYSAAAFIPLLIIASVILYAVHRRSA